MIRFFNTVTPVVIPAIAASDVQKQFLSPEIYDYFSAVLELSHITAHP